jgi:prolipoprotein diacylglyceryltransferase
MDEAIPCFLTDPCVLPKLDVSALLISAFLSGALLFHWTMLKKKPASSSRTRWASFITFYSIARIAFLGLAPMD